MGAWTLHAIEKLIVEIPWYAKYALLVGGALMSAFAGTFPLSIQTWGRDIGIACASLGFLAVAWHWINLWREHLRKPRLKVEPLHLIVMGLGGVLVFAAVAFGGAIWLWRSTPSSINTSLSGTTLDAKPLQTAAHKFDPVLAAERTPQDIRQKKREAIQEILPEFTTQLEQTFNLLEYFESAGSYINQGLAKKYLEDVKKLQARYQAAEQEIDFLRQKYRLYKDITDLIQIPTWNDLDGAMNNVLVLVGYLGPDTKVKDPEALFQTRKQRMHKALNDMSGWRVETADILTKFYQELAK